MELNMQIKEYKLVFFMLILSVLGPLWSQNLSLERALQLALENNPSWLAKLAETELARENVTSAMSSFLPSLKLDGTWLYMEPAQSVQTSMGPIDLNKDMRQFGLTLTQPIFLGGKAWQAYQMAKLGEQLGLVDLESERLSLLSEVNKLYLNLLQTQDLQKISELDRQSASLNLEIAQIKYDQGLLSNADLLRFKSQLASKEVMLLQAGTALQLSRLQLKNMLTLDYLPVAEELPEIDNDPVLAVLEGYGADDVSALSQRALQQGRESNSALKALDGSLELSRRGMQIAKGSFLPSVVLVGTSNFNENGIDRYKFNNSNQIMLTASLPLLPMVGNVAEHKKAQLKYRKALLDVKAATDAVFLGTEAAVLNLVGAAKQFRANSIALEYTRQSYLQMQERFRMELISSKDLLDAELMLSATRISHSTAVFDYHKARIALMQLLAFETPQQLDSMIITGE